jgi:hypothetical protein
MSETKWWSNKTANTQATIVGPTGSHHTGRIHCWIGPGECELANGKRGVLLETWQRRQATAS